MPTIALSPTQRSWKVLSVLLLMLVALSAIASPSNKWRIKVNHETRAGGEIELAFTPKGATAIPVVIVIPAGTHENAAAHLIRDGIRAKFGKSVYKTELDDGEDVLVRKKRGIPDFEITIVRNTAEGLTLKLHRE